MGVPQMGVQTPDDPQHVPIVHTVPLGQSPVETHRARSEQNLLCPQTHVHSAVVKAKQSGSPHGVNPVSQVPPPSHSAEVTQTSFEQL
jgi:hypothetical protein